MLPRAARRRNVLHQLRLSTEHLALPWLCPAALRPHTQLSRPENASNATSSTPSALRRRRSFSQPVRHLATATDSAPLLNSSTHVPFDSMGYTGAGTQSARDSLFSPLLGHSLFNEPAIMIQESQLVTGPSLKRSRGIGGSLDEMMARFMVLLKSREISAAAQVLERMAHSYTHGDPRFLDLHNLYLEAVVADMIDNKSSQDALKKALSLQTWFEVKLPKGHLKPNARTMAIMLRMTLRMLHGSRRDRTVRRYWNMVQQNSFELEVMSMNEILTERDLGEISQVSTLFSHLLSSETTKKLTI